MSLPGAGTAAYTDAEVRTGETVRADISFDAGRITGRVTDSTTGRGLSGVDVHGRRTGADTADEFFMVGGMSGDGSISVHNRPRGVKTDDRGYYEIPWAPPTTREITLDWDTAAPAKRERHREPVVDSGALGLPSQTIDPEHHEFTQLNCVSQTQI